MSKEVDDRVKALTRKLVDEGKLIEAGWATYHLLVIPNASPVQVSETRKGFFAGAQHLFGSINSMLTEDQEPTEQDMDRMSAIAVELQKFVDELKGSMD